MFKPHDTNLLKTLLYKSHYDDSGDMVYQNHELCHLQGLTDIGLLRPTTPSEFYRCDCEYGGGEVYWSHVGEQDYAHVRCGCGSYRIDSQDIRRWELVFPALLRRIGESMGFTPPFQEVHHGLVWQLGRWKRRDIYYLRRADFDLRRTLRDIFSPHPTAILVVPTTACIDFLDSLSNICFAIENIGSMDKSFNLTIDMTSIEAELEPADVETKRQRAKRGNRAANIEKLIAEMKEHYRTAKDHYFTSGGNLLPRPTQMELAKRVGIRQNEVSRCLKDSDATMFQLLWKQAEDERAILNS